MVLQFQLQLPKCCRLVLFYMYHVLRLQSYDSSTILNYFIEILQSK